MEVNPQEEAFAKLRKMASKDEEKAFKDCVLLVKKLALLYSEDAESILREGDFIIFREETVNGQRSKALVGLGDGIVVELY